jgi:hypothetical protein
VSHATVPQPSRVTEVTVLIVANLLASTVRFVLYRSWVFRPKQVPPEPGPVASGTLEAASSGEYTTPAESHDTAVGDTSSPPLGLGSVPGLPSEHAEFL